MNMALLRVVLATVLSWAPTLPALAQGTFVISSGTFEPTPVAGHHIDSFAVVSSMPIKSLEAGIFLAPMRQINPGERLTVFPTLLSPSEFRSDSHFVFDTTFANILFEFEDSTQIRTKVEFTSNFPTSFELAQIVAAEGHSPFIAHISGSLVDGTRFISSFSYIPEPSIQALGAVCLFVLLLARSLNRTRAH